MSSLPLRPMLLAALVGAVLLAVDALARRFGLYDGTLADWPAVGRVRQAEPADLAVPRRAAQPATWEPVVPGGIPRAVSAYALTTWVTADSAAGGASPAPTQRELSV